MINLYNPVGLAHYITWILGIVAIGYALKKNYPWTVTLAFGFTAFSALRIYQNSLNGTPVDPIIQQFDHSAQGAMLSLLFSMMIVQAIPISKWVKIFKALAVINAVALCGHFIYFVVAGLIHHQSWSEILQNEPWGILLNASMSGCFNACLFPLFDRKEKYLKWLVVISVVVAGRSLPIAVLFSGIGASLLIQKKYRALAVAVPASLAVGFMVKGVHLFSTRGRDLIWAHAFVYFRDHLRWAIGSGLGGFFVIGPVLTPVELHFTFIWLHSDWMQILFETGIIGFIFVVAMYGQALWKSRVNPALFSAVTAYAAFGVANMPLRYPIAGLLGAFLIRWALEKPVRH